MNVVALFVIDQKLRGKNYQQVSLFIVIYPHKGCTIDTLCNLDESQNKYAEWKKSYKQYIVYDFTYLRF